MDYLFIIYGLPIIALVITLIAQGFVSSSYSKYSKVKNERGITGKEAARYLLDKNGLSEVDVVETTGYLTDHYDPRSKIIKLSRSVYNDASIAAVSVACHECGHAIQDKVGYTFLKIRSALVPVVNFSSYAGYFAILFGCLFGALNLIWVGIFAEVIILLFQIITLPVEVNASKRALQELESANFFNSNELKHGKTMLTAAALTYVASIATTIIQILRLFLMFGRNND